MMATRQAVKEVEVPEVSNDAEEPKDEELVSVEHVRQMIVESGLERLTAQASQGIVNPIVLARFLDIKPQQIYNRIRAGSIDAVRENNTQKLTIELDEAIRFARAYLDRKARQQAKIEAELRGE